MTREKAYHDAILAWCRREKRPTGMRQFDDAPGGATCVVCRLDMFQGVYVSKFGMPVEPRRFDPAVVLAAGASWEVVAEQLQILIPKFDASGE